MPTGELVKYFLLLATSIFKQQPNNNNNNNNNYNNNEEDDNNNFHGYEYNNNDDYYNEITTATATTSTTTTAQHDSLQYTTDYYFDYFNDSSFFNSCIYSDVVDLDCLSYWMMMNFSNFDLSTPLDDLLDELPSNFGALFLLPFPVLTVFGNILVVLSVIKERNLQTVTNYFIVSLAVADIMVAIFVMPLAVYVEVNNSLWMLGDILCDVWVALDVLCCTASILNLTAISVDRFFAVTQPIKYARHKNSKRVYVMLGVTWVISVAISSPIVLGANYTERRTQTKYLCTFYNSNFLIYSSMGSFYIPCIVMVLLYGKIFNAIRVRARKAAAQKKIKSVSGKNTSVRIQSVKTFQSPSVLVNHCTGNVDELVEGGHNASRPCVVIDNRNAVETSLVDNSCSGELCEPFSTKTPAPLNSVDKNDVSSQVQMEGNAVVISNKSPCDCQNAVLSDAEIFTDSCTLTNSIFLKPPVTDEHHESPESCACGIAIQSAYTDEGQLGSRSPMRDLKTSSDQERNCRRKTDVRSTAHTFHFRFKKTKVKKSLKNEKKLQSAQRRERKATKTLAIVLGVFLFCWVPFFTINIMNAICIRYDLVSGVCQLDPILFSFFVWLGYMNSFINPVIYTIFNIEFRRAFKKLLKPIFKFKDA